MKAKGPKIIFKKTVTWGWSHLTYRSATRHVLFWFLLGLFIFSPDFSWLFSDVGFGFTSTSRPESSGRVSGGRHQALWRGEPQVHLSLSSCAALRHKSIYGSQRGRCGLTKALTSHRGAIPRGLAVTLLPILPTRRLGGKLREGRCWWDWGRALTDRDLQ